MKMLLGLGVLCAIAALFCTTEGCGLAHRDMLTFRINGEICHLKFITGRSFDFCSGGCTSRVKYTAVQNTSQTEFAPIKCEGKLNCCVSRGKSTFTGFRIVTGGPYVCTYQHAASMRIKMPTNCACGSCYDVEQFPTEITADGEIESWKCAT